MTKKWGTENLVKEGKLRFIITLLTKCVKTSRHEILIQIQWKGFSPSVDLDLILA